MNQYKLSIWLPAFRVHLWEEFYKSINDSIGEYSWELIIVGPNEPSDFFKDKKNFKFLKDFGSPTRCAQIATMLAEGELMTWASDDGIFTKNSLKECIEMKNKLNKEDIVIMRYTEGRSRTGSELPIDYWRAWHHPPLRMRHVPKDYSISLLAMYNLEYFRELGGWDCRYEHLNFSVHDLAFRAQRNSSGLFFSPQTVLNCDWNPNEGDHKPVHEAYNFDLKYFEECYNQEEFKVQIKIDYNNWTKSPIKWRRF